MLALGASPPLLDSDWALSAMEQIGIEQPDAGGEKCWTHTEYRSSTLEFVRGREAEVAGDLREAAAAYGEAVAVDPSNEAAWLGLARVGRTAKNPRLAQAAWSKRLQLCPRDVKALRANAEQALHAGRVKDALELLLRHRAESPEDSQFQRVRWDAAIGVGLAEAGEDELAVEARTQARESLLRLATELEVDRFTRRDWEWLLRRLTVEGSRPFALAAARARLESGKLHRPADRGRMTSMCIVLNAVDHNSAATAALLNSLPEDDLRLRLEFRAALSPAMMRYRASTIHATLGDRSGAIELLRDAAALDPDEAGVLNNLGYMLLEQDPDSVEAAKYLELALELDPQDAGTLDSVGYLRLLQGRYQDGPTGRGALSLLREAARRTDHMDPIILLHLGDAEVASGSEKAARSTWRHALALVEHPEFQEERTRSYDVVQAEDWGIYVLPSSDLYHLEFGDVAPALRERLAAQTSED